MNGRSTKAKDKTERHRGVDGKTMMAAQHTHTHINPGHTHTHTIVRVCQEEADSMRKDRNKERERGWERERERIAHEHEVMDREWEQERERNRKERKYLERRLLLLEEKLGMQEVYISELSKSSRRGLRNECRQEAAINGLCALMNKSRDQELLRAVFSAVMNSLRSPKIDSNRTSTRWGKPDGNHQQRNAILEMWAKKMVQRLMNDALVSTFEMWRDHTIKGMQIKRKAVKVVQRLMNGALVSTFERWRDHIMKEMQMKRKALKVIQRLTNGALISSFERWRDHVVEEKQMKRKAVRVVQRLIKGALVSTFERWRDHIIEQMQMKWKAVKVVRRLMRRGLISAYERWKQTNVTQKKNRNKGQKVHQMLLRRSLVLSYERWKMKWARQKVMTCKTFKVVQRKSNTKLVHALGRWKYQIIQVKKIRSRSLQVVKRLISRDLNNAFSYWLRMHHLTGSITRLQLRKAIMDKGKVGRLVDRWRRQWRRQRLILHFLDLFLMRQSYNLMGRVLQQWQHSIVMKQIYLESREEAAEAAAWWLSKQSTLQDAFQHWRTVVARLRSRYTRIHRFMHRRLLALSSRHLRQERMRAQSRSEKRLRRGGSLNPVFLHVCKLVLYIQ
jgi:hypothetical protein